MICVLALTATVVMQRPTDIVKWSAEGPAKSVRAGSVVRIALTARVETDWKLYSLAQPKGGPIPLEITLAKDTPFTLASKDIVAPAAKAQNDELFSGGKTQYYESRAAFVVPVTVPKTVPPGDHTVPLEITFQACGKEICLRPFTQRLDVTITVVR